MGAQRLGPKKLRKLELALGGPVLRAWASGGYVHSFVTPDHHHGWWDIKTDQIEWAPAHSLSVHSTSCDETWPGWRDTLPAPTPEFLAEMQAKRDERGARADRIDRFAAALARG